MLLRNRLARAAYLFIVGAGWVQAAPAAITPDLQKLDGRWRFQLDREDQGETQHWFERALDQELALPGSLQEQGFGDPPSDTTEWIARIGANLLKEPRYAAYREPGHFRTPFWLTPDRHYVGSAWYQRDIDIPAAWKGRRVVLFLERPHWETRVWVDGQAAGTQNGLGVPHEYDLTTLAQPGHHRLTIRVDNRLVIPVGRDAHSVSDQTQGAWNGIVGRVELRTTPVAFIDDVQVRPDVVRRLAHVSVTIKNQSGRAGSGTLRVTAESTNAATTRRVAAKAVPVRWTKDGGTVEFDYALGPNAQLWDEFSPALYRLTLDGLGQPVTVTFGLREIGTSGTQFTLNGRRIYLRGTLECAVFPLTAYPPTDVASWKRILTIARAHGLNHLRFHSWTPPEAAFVAADELGFFYQVEVSAWAPFGDGTALDTWVYEETERTLRAYGNHPSFVLLAPANEPGGKDRDRFLGAWVKHWSERDARRRYTAGSGWPIVPENEYHVAIQPRMQGTHELNHAPQTTSDYREHVARYTVPIVSHEIGQWTAYPNFEEIPKYTGLLKPGNLEIFQDFLNKSGMGDQAKDFVRASGRFQALLYKAEIEEALRTPGMGGFQLLDLHDFPGQGTAPVGVLDAFWDSKGYVTPEQYHRFCSETVPLARLAKRVFTNDETFSAHIEVAHFGARDLAPTASLWRITAQGRLIASGRLDAQAVPTGGLTTLGDVSLPLDKFEGATRLNLEVTLEGTTFVNDWDVWVYPARKEVITPASVRVFEDQGLDSAVEAALAAGERVLLLPGPKRIKGGALGVFRPIFWNRVTFTTQKEHTVGLLIDPAHKALARFPTEFHSNWQWWDLAQRSRPMILDGLPSELHPVVQPIDDWNLCRKLGLLIEAKVGNGRLLLSSIDLSQALEERPVARQLRSSLMLYMDSPAFAPSVALNVEQVRSLLQDLAPMDRLGATVLRTDGEWAENPAPQILDDDPTSFWASSRQSQAFGGTAAPYPHEIVIKFKTPARLSGIEILPRQDEERTRIKDYRVEASDDDKTWTEVAAGTFAPGAEWQTVTFTKTLTLRFLRLVALSGQQPNVQATIAEIRAAEASP
jgi:F5/8 type C domain/Glycosyl hydrolases family 2, sugar binding domain/Glycosyl hydrolases family 2